MINISYSLKGTNPLYVKVLEWNLKNFRTFYPDGQIIIHHDESSLNQINQWNNDYSFTSHQWDKDESLQCHFWRFWIEDQNIPQIIRDADSVLSHREVSAVQSWLQSDKDHHVMRDHAYHTNQWYPYPIMGGMWGTKNAPLNWNTRLSWWIKNKFPFERAADSWYLNRYLYPDIRFNGIEHDSQGSSWGGIPFPTPRTNSHYVGEVANWQNLK